MNETMRTLTFVAVALVSLLVAVFAAPTIEDPLTSADLGKEFFPEFNDPSQATSLEVVVYDENTATARRFAVEFKEGLWRIPSHNNYPADGGERLAKTAASLIGVKRDEFRTRSPADHTELGVMDPLDEQTELKGRGDRITLKRADGGVLADFIIGKKVADRSGYYYVRRPGNDATYVAKLDVELSTKFADWVETDLLQLNRDDLVSVLVNKYSVDERRGTIVDQEVNELSREKSSDTWTLKELDEETSELNTEKINNMVAALDDLKLIGVRKKPEGLSQDLKLNEGIRLDPFTAADLGSKGFFFVKDAGLVSNEGETIATAKQGVVYVLRFGEIFQGTGLELEAGVEADKRKDEQTEAENDKDEKSAAAEEKDKNDTDAQQGRYLFVTTQFDAEALGPKPEQPQRPAELDAAAVGQEIDTESEQEADTKSGSNVEAEKETAPKQDDGPAADDKQAEKKSKEELEQKYQQQLKDYESELKAYQEKVEEGKKKVKELNRRFADWYFVISEDSFKDLRLSRSELVKKKETPQSESEKPEAETEAEAEE